jgi:hypothetical protein
MKALRIIGGLMSLVLAAVLLMASGEIFWIHLVDIPRVAPRPVATLSFGPVSFEGWQIYAVATAIAVAGLFVGYVGVSAFLSLRSER